MLFAKIFILRFAGVKLPFQKYHGAGNDFIMVDGFTCDVIPDERQVRYLCDRHRGIGADGLIIILPDPSVSFRMQYFNSDGKESTMCGNGGRCAAVFAHLYGIAGSDMVFSASDGLHQASILRWADHEGMVRVELGDVAGIEKILDGYFLNTGSPHFVVFREEDFSDVTAEGRLLRDNPVFGHGGTNVDFVMNKDSGIFVRTYERGVEDETLSCGTGVTAAVLATIDQGKIDLPLSGIFTVPVITRGGRLLVHGIKMGNLYSRIALEGPVQFVFRGEARL